MKIEKYLDFFNKFFVVSIVFIIVQQSIVATSTYLIAKIGQDFGKGVLTYDTIALFAASLIIVYLPAYYAIYFLEKGKYKSWQNYVNKFNEYFLGKTTYANDSDLKKNAIALLSQESKDTIDHASNIGFDLLSLILNIIFNVTIIAFVLDSSILLAYTFGMILSFLFIYYLNPRIDKYATTAQNSRLDLIAKLHKSWDNIILNNRYHSNIYHQAINRQFKDTTNKNLTAEKARYLSATLGMLILMIPVLFVIFYLFRENWHNEVTLAVLIATLPRQIQLLQMCYTLIGYNVGMVIIKARMKGLLDIFHHREYDLKTFIQLDKIKVKQTGGLFDDYNLPNVGRITLIGDNGVGKSCLLLSLKEQYHDKAYYLPSKHDLLFCNKFTHQGSSGQALIRQLEELMSNLSDDVKIILLDEWDAHLDNHNMIEIDNKLDCWAKNKLIIEVRHR